MKLVLSSTIISSLAALPATVYGHGYLETPMARNLYAHREGRSGNPSNAPAIPLYQTTPQGLNRNKNVCGMDQGYPDNDYDSWLDTQGNPMPWISQAIYNPGDIIEVNSFLTAHHKGYLEVKGCPRGRDSTQECFDSYPLEFVKDLLYDMPQDTAYPNRGYLHGVEPRLSMQFKLPEGLVGEQVLLQWVYWTANSCNPIGFAEYYSTPKPVGPTGPNWNSLLSTCPPESETPIAPIPNPNSSVLAPERFINCAEVTVTGVQTPAPPFPSPIPPPTSAPVENPVTSPPVSQPPINPGIVGTCGGGNTGNGICPDHSMCCSKWGHCGYESTGHCDQLAPIDAPSNPIPPPVSSPVAPPTSAPVENPVSQPPINPGIVGTCGGGNTGNGICPDHSMCCSKWGYCGYESTGHCDQLAPIDAPSNPIPPPVSSPVAPPTSAPVENPVTSPPVSQPPMNPGIVGTCGGGNTGNGICPDHSMCCSKWGHCGYESTGHCDQLAPIDAPSNPIPPPVSSPVAPPTSAPVENPVTSPPISQPPINPGIVGTCGGGNTGNGICPVHSMCCSKWGYCGYESTGHCDDPAPIDAPSNPIPMPVSPPVSMPVDAPTLPLPPTHDHHDDNSRLIAYLGNWQSCPSDEQVARYTHIVIAFAVSYTWSPGKNVCSETCEIMVPPVCGDAARPDLIQKWKNMGKKVILSFGGAGMGGSWVGDNNDCWDYCFGRETQVVDRLTDIVNEMGLDGIDIDYEYFYEDHQNGSGFTKGAEAQNFLSQVTIGLRDSMPAGFELTHAPMEPDMVPGKGYFEVLKEVASSLDFLMPQYYNGYVQSHSNFDGALDHYTTLANQMFNGDASKIVYGFCINDCGSFNLDGYESAEVMEWLSKEYPCNGGAFFWVANDDRNSEWSIPVRDQLLIDSEQC